MKTPIVVKLAEPSDSTNLIEWCQRTLEDKDVLIEPSTLVTRAENGRPVSYAIMRPVLLIDAIAADPKSSVRERVLSLKSIIDGAVKLAKQFQISEIYFLGDTDDGKLQALAETRAGFSKSPFALWRRKV